MDSRTNIDDAGRRELRGVRPLGADDARAYKRFVKSAFPDKKNRQYVYQLKMTVQRVSVALQRAIGEAAVLFNRRARAFPAVAMSPAAEEHAAT